MRGDVMQWVGRLVAAVFGFGALALLGAVFVLVRQAEGVPPMPVFLGLLGMAVLVLLAGACLGIISIAVSARRGAEALQRMAGGGVAKTGVAGSEMQGPVAPLEQALAVPPRQTPRPTPRPGRVLVAER
ncbi:hypothetical protein PANO111632_15055 [Paracoccus nototheniae]|uniref:Lipopolysaccharide assembly protein A domain-containing protein n=1 Tax=Paracoccus nototheniae TaxID=2489002 RepID=A0ABW4DSD1_9RHOB|nr:hypothetical protein [Paracoccus nototheniae]